MYEGDQSHSNAHQKQNKQAYQKLLEYAFKQTLEWFVCGDNIKLEQMQLLNRLPTKPSAVVMG